MSFNDIKNLPLRTFLKDNFKVGIPIDSVQASLAFGTGDSQISFQAVTGGIQGNFISVKIVNSSENDCLLSFTFDVINKLLTIYPEKVSGSIVSIGSDIADLLNSDLTVSEYLTTTGGSGVVDWQVETNLSGGINGSEGIAGVTRYVHGNDIYICYQSCDYSSTGNWRKISGSSISYDSVLDYDEILDYNEILD